MGLDWNNIRKTVAAETDPPAPRKKPDHAESKLQIQCVTWFRYQWPGLLLYAVPNGGKRGKVEAGIMKEEGVLRGMPDLNLDEARGGYFGLRIEMKPPGFKDNNSETRRKQRERQQQLQDAGYRAVLIDNFDDFRFELTEYLKLPRTARLMHGVKHPSP